MAGRNGNIRSRIETITPEMATKWLEGAASNRNIMQRRVDEMARDMKAGKWLLTGQPIIFDFDNALRDGQHRLWGCVQADVPFRSLVVRGVDPSVVIAIDIGAKRTLGQYLKILSEPNYNVLGAAINMTWRYHHHRLREPVNPTHEEAIDWLDQNGEMRDSVMVAMQVRREGGIPFSPSPIATAHFLNAQTDSDSATLFWEKVATGAELHSGDAILALRRWITTAASGRERPRTDVAFAHFMKAMNLWRLKRNVKILSWKTTEDMPEPWKDA